MIRLFDTRLPLREKLGEGHARLKAEIDGESDQYVREVDLSSWIAHLASKHAVEPPQVLAQEPPVEDLGEVQVDVSDMPGVSMSTSEMFGGQPAMRTGRRVRLTVPLAGTSDLLRFWPEAGTPVIDVEELRRDGVSHTWEWPLERGAEALQQEITAVFGTVRDGAARVADQVEGVSDLLCVRPG